HRISGNFRNSFGTGRGGTGSGTTSQGGPTMKGRSASSFALAAFLIAAGCGSQSPVSTHQAEFSGAEARSSVTQHSGAGSRTTIAPGIGHYVWTVRTGEGQYDQIRVHRVTQENSEGRPERSLESVFMVHGDSWGFEPAFPGAGSAHSVAVPLARAGVDVWGIDQAWTLLPADLADASFTAGWGMQHDIDDVERAIAFARAKRLLSASHPGRVH